MAAWSDPVLGVYCERLDPSFWAEPANAVTNVAFIMAAAIAARRHRGDRAALVLAAVVAVIGVGSFLFHTFATRWALLADVAPIQLFIAVYFCLVLRRIVGIGALGAVVGTVAFIAAAAALPALAPAGALGGSPGYAGALLALIGMGVGLTLAQEARRRSAGKGLLAAAALFATSLTFRTLDGAACAYSPVGAHPLWHVLNACVLFTLIETFGRARPSKIPANDH
ncbi:hypothetical protein JOD31_000239 [Methylopila capsulata]|uniref:Membrane protein n=1 Tax=Methylopila capsulata TaxID=61654 RepID=A0A9W6MRJ6_9HYPH|nr:ceramidase domain-containing protein [Methylopila capsulata]MBM7850027.1 hypothetical protein [Methylopila capsulata]GLK55318.1 membrane protein [Methylopila capsulata]